MTPGLTFDADSHTYRLDGNVIPGTTGALKRLGLLPAHERTDPFYRERGKAVHEAIRLDFSGELDEESVDPENVKPYLERARWVREILGLVPIAQELALASYAYKYAGTLDLFGRANALDEHILLDWKNGAIEPGHILQVSAYDHLLHQDETIKLSPGAFYNMRRAVVSLATSPPKIRWFSRDELSSAFETFRAALAVYNALPTYGGTQ